MRATRCRRRQACFVARLRCKARRVAQRLRTRARLASRRRRCRARRAARCRLWRRGGRRCGRRRGCCGEQRSRGCHPNLLPSTSVAREPHRELASSQLRQPKRERRRRAAQRASVKRAAIKHERCERTSVKRGSVKRASVERRAGVERASVEQAAASARAGELQGEHGSSELQSAASCNKRAPQPMTTTALPNCGRRRTAVRARRASAPFDDVDGAGRMAPLSCDV